jgi:putative hemolysin
VLLPRELLHKQGEPIGLRVGSAIENRQLCEFSTSETLMTYLRGRTYALARTKPKTSLVKKLPFARGRRHDPGRAALAPEAVPAETLEAELASLPADQKLAENGDLSVYCAEPTRTPKLLEALGRLREITFRAVGEGTGRGVDLDGFDYRYQHLLIWDGRERQLVGSYRLGPTDLLAQGEAGTDPKQPLYVQTLFKLKPGFLESVEPGIELGRSFVRQSYQRSFAPLMLLWRAIGQFVAQQPRYRYLFGPVTISAAYSPASQALMVEALMRPPFLSTLAASVEPRRPFKARHPARDELARLGHMVDSVDHLDALIRDIETDGKGVPILLKQYLKLGAKCLAFNRDPDFGDCLDVLCVFDVLECNRRTMHKYLGREATQQYLAAHGVE